MRFDFGMSDKCPANGARNWFVLVVSEHSFYTMITKKMLIRTCKHGPPSHYVVGFKADIAYVRTGAFSVAKSWYIFWLL